jgi:acetolactate synthase-1/3 small subunit
MNMASHLQMAHTSELTKSEADGFQKHTISVLFESRPGAFNRITGLFATKGYDLDSITVAQTEEPEVSRMTIVTRGDDAVIEQIIKQLNRLIDTITVVDLTFESYVERDLVLVKVQSSAKTRSEVMQIGEIFRAKVIDISPDTLTLEATGSQQKIDAIISMLRPFGIKELARTGRVALRREFEGEI